MSAIVEFVLEFVFGLLWWLILFPVVWLLAAPFILIIALFRWERFDAAVFEMFSSLHRFWKEWGIMVVP